MDLARATELAAVVVALVLALRKLAPRIDGLLVLAVAAGAAALVVFAFSPTMPPALEYVREVLLVACASITVTHLADRIGDRVGAPPASGTP